MLHHLTYSNWFAFGAVLFLLETVTRNGHAFWLGVLAGFFALVTLFFHEISSVTMLILFVFLALVQNKLWRNYVKKSSAEMKHFVSKDENKKYIGQVFTLASATKNGLGKIAVDDTIWRVRVKNDLPQGSVVKITSVDGVILIGEQG